MASSSQLDATTILLLILGAIILLPLLMMGMGFGGMMGYGGMMGDYGGYGMAPIWGLIMMGVWLLVLVGGAYLIYRLVASNHGVGPDQALEELRVEYARGNITEEEFEERREKLRRD